MKIIKSKSSTFLVNTIIAAKKKQLAAGNEIDQVLTTITDDIQAKKDHFKFFTKLGAYNAAMKKAGFNDPEVKMNSEYPKKLMWQLKGVPTEKLMKEMDSLLKMVGESKTTVFTEIDLEAKSSKSSASFDVGIHSVLDILVEHRSGVLTVTLTYTAN